jgi:hypothetical protein
MQGSIERSNAPFKRSLYEWMEKNPREKWAKLEHLSSMHK